MVKQRQRRKKRFLLSWHGDIEVNLKRTIK